MAPQRKTLLTQTSETNGIEKELSLVERQKSAEKAMRASVRLAHYVVSQKPGFRNPGTPWRDEALCAVLQPHEKEYFSSDNKHEKTLAKIACEACPVQDLCREDAIERREQFFVYGGLDADERRSEIRKRTAPARDARRAQRAAMKASRAR
jgi:WhiB family redox-sensing transcriptional regulator